MSSSKSSDGSTATRVGFRRGMLEVALSDRRVLAVPVAWYPRLDHGTARERNDWKLIAGGRGIHWPQLDEDISIENLLGGRALTESAKSLNRWLSGRARSRNRRNRKPAAA